MEPLKQDIANLAKESNEMMKHLFSIECNVNKMENNERITKDIKFDRQKFRNIEFNLSEAQNELWMGEENINKLNILITQCKKYGKLTYDCELRKFIFSIDKDPINAIDFLLYVCICLWLQTYVNHSVCVCVCVCVVCVS